MTQTTANPQPNKYPVTSLFLLGREWQADDYARRLLSPYYSTTFLRQDAESALVAAVAYDY